MVVDGKEVARGCHSVGQHQGLGGVTQILKSQGLLSNVQTSIVLIFGAFYNPKPVLDVAEINLERGQLTYADQANLLQILSLFY